MKTANQGIQETLQEIHRRMVAQKQASQQQAKARTLLEISEDLTAIANMIDDSLGIFDSRGDELDDRLTAWFDDVMTDLHGKADNYVALIRSLEETAKVRQAEAKRMRILASVDEGHAKRLRDRLKSFMEAHDIPKIKTARFNIAIQKNGGKPALNVNVASEDLPVEFQNIIVEPDKKAIREALEVGVTVLGCEIAERGTSLRIR